MKKYLFLLLLLFIPFFAHADVDHLVISQVQITGGTGHTNDDFIELFNPTDHELDLNGMTLVRRTAAGSSDETIKSWTTSAIIPAYSFYLLAHPDYTSISPDATFASGQALASNNGIALKDSMGTIIDTLAWGTVTNSFGEGAAPANPGTSKALARLFNDHQIIQDTNNNTADFPIPFPNSNPHNLAFSPFAPIVDPPPDSPEDPDPPPEEDPEDDETDDPDPPAPTYSSAVIISEFLPNPAGSDSEEEWVELFSTQDVDLSGWKLDDEGAPDTVGSSAFVLPSNTHISANQYLTITIPEGKFALDNSGGDSLRLVWPNNHTLQSVSYSVTASEDHSLARLPSAEFAWTTILTPGAANQFAASESDDEESVDDSSSEISTAEPAIDYIQINEILPNPKGADAGQEWVELKNTGTQPVYVHNWTLDTGDADNPISKKAYQIQSPTIPPGGVAILLIPSGKFTMKNTGDTIRLFDPNNILISTITYKAAKEGMSYALVGDEWLWLVPSPDQVNAIPEKIVYSDEISINELFPEPSKGVEEFIELKNFSGSEVNLKGWVLSDSVTEYKFGELVIAAGGLAVIYKSQSKISLNNFGGEVVTLKNPLDEIVDQVEYEDPPKNQSYNLIAENYIWSGLVTPGEENRISSGRVAGVLLPRTGVNDQFGLWDAFVIWAILWYIYIKLNRKEWAYEQTRIS